MLYLMRQVKSQAIFVESRFSARESGGLRSHIAVGRLGRERVTGRGVKG